MCIFLNDHYIEDDDNKVKIYHSIDEIRYCCGTPGMIADLHFCIRNSANNKIMATILGQPKKVVINKETVPLVEANFLAVHKALRGKKMGQHMIQEFTRRGNLAGKQVGLYKSPDAKPTPFATVNFMNRLLNLQKLIDVGFVQTPDEKQMEIFKKKERLPDLKSFSIVGNVRSFAKKDAAQVLKLYNQKMAEMQVC